MNILMCFLLAVGDHVFIAYLTYIKKTTTFCRETCLRLVFTDGAALVFFKQHYWPEYVEFIVKNIKEINN